MTNGATPEVTPDHGLSGLGLLMQLVGGSLAVLMAGLLLLTLTGNTPGQLRAWLLVMLAVGAASGAVQFAAGRAVSSGASGALARVRQCVYLGWIQAAIAVAFLSGQMSVPFGHALLIAVAYLGVWPTFLFVVSSREPYRSFLGGRMPETPDRGAEGLAIYMSLLGSIGVLCTLFVVQMMVKGQMLRAWQGTVILITVLLLTLRSSFHVAAGLKGALRQDWPVFHEAAERYVLAGRILAALCGVAWLVIVLLMTGPEIGALITIAMFVGLLLVWPAVVSRFLEQGPPRPSGSEADQTPTPGTAPDRGLTALGWLLLSSGVWGGAFALVGLVLGSQGGLGGGFGSIRQEQTGQTLGLIVAVLQVFAGSSLVRMAPSWKTATLGYAAIGAVLSVIHVVRGLGEFRGVPFIGGPGDVVIFALAISLVMPIGSGLLVLRGSRRTA